MNLLEVLIFWALLVIGTILIATKAHADDTILVHDLAHAGSGGIVAVASDGILDALKPVPWYTRLAVDFASAVLVDELYELSTHKTAAVSLEHDGLAGLGGLWVAGVSLHWEFK